jgi:hypothetical protein
VQVEDVPGVRLASRWPAEEQGDLPVGPSVPGEVVVDHQGVAALLHEVFPHGARGERRQVLHGGRGGCAGRHHDGVRHGPLFLELGHGLGDGAPFLPDGAVDAHHLGQAEIQSALVDDGVHGERGLPRVAVPDQKLALTPADRGQGVNGLDPSLERDVHRRALGDARGNTLQGHHGAPLHAEGLAIQGHAEGVDHPAQQVVRHGDGERQARGPDLSPLTHGGVLGEHEHRDEILVQVHHQAAPAVLQLHQLPIAGTGEPLNLRDAVRHARDPADVVDRGPDLDRGQLLLQFTNQVFCFHVPPSASIISAM